VTVFRRACAADSAELTRIAHAAKRHWGYPDELIDLWKEDLTLLPADVEENLVFCAERDGAIAGFYSVSGAGTAAGEIEHMWVLPGHIGTGLGRALFEHMVGRLRESGVKTLRIESDPNAAAFYERMGARREGDVRATPAGRTLPLLVLTIA
jgi:GNAT superfamily N-acetyltransferase